MRTQNFLKIAALVAVLTGVLIMTGCNAKPTQLTQADDGSQVSLKIGDTLVISLPGNLSTGFTWVVESGADELLELIGEPEFTAEDTGLVGSGGVLKLTFEAKSAGSTTLVLAYQQPWETEVEPEQRFTLQVTIE